MLVDLWLGQTKLPKENQGFAGLGGSYARLPQAIMVLRGHGKTLPESNFIRAR